MRMRSTPSRLPTLLVLAVALSGLQCSDPSPTGVTRANVLLYVVDTLRADALGAYGALPPRTPEFDRLAQEGVLFERAYAPASWTRPSMASLLTGTSPAYHGTESREHHLPEELETLAETLSARGYATAFVTTNPNAASFFGFSQGFDDMIELFDRQTPGRVDESELIATSREAGLRAEEWLESASRPFFLSVLTVDPHFPHTPPPELIEGDEPLLDLEVLFDPPDAATNSDEPIDMLRVQRQHRRLYQAEVTFNDQSFGLLIRTLRERGELDETIVVFTADHGEEFWEHGRLGHGNTLYEEVLHVPLVFRYPALVEPGRRVEHVVGTVDVVPTLLSLLDLPTPAAVTGRSLLQEPHANAEPVFASLALGEFKLYSANDGRFKLVVDETAGTSQLYDTETDQSERSPLEVGAGAPTQPARARLEQAIRKLAARRSGFDTSAAGGVAPAGVSEALKALGYIE